MTLRIPMHRGIVALVHAMILTTMTAIVVVTDVLNHANPMILIIYLMVPAMVMAWSILRIDRRARILGYWGLAALMVPLAGLGIFGGFGLLYLIGIIFLLWAAWTENEGKA